MRSASRGWRWRRRRRRNRQQRAEEEAAEEAWREEEERARREAESELRAAQAPGYGFLPVRPQRLAAAIEAARAAGVDPTTIAAAEAALAAQVEKEEAPRREAEARAKREAEEAARREAEAQEAAAAADRARRRAAEAAETAAAAAAEAAAAAAAADEPRVVEIDREATRSEEESAEAERARVAAARRRQKEQLAAAADASRARDRSGDRRDADPRRDRRDRDLRRSTSEAEVHRRAEKEARREARRRAEARAMRREIEAEVYADAHRYGIGGGGSHRPPSESEHSQSDSHFSTSLYSNYAPSPFGTPLFGQTPTASHCPSHPSGATSPAYSSGTHGRGGATPNRGAVGYSRSLLPSVPPPPSAAWLPDSRIGPAVPMAPPPVGAGGGYPMGAACVAHEDTRWASGGYGSSYGGSYGGSAGGSYGGSAPPPYPAGYQPPPQQLAPQHQYLASPQPTQYMPVGYTPMQPQHHMAAAYPHGVAPPMAQHPAQPGFYSPPHQRRDPWGAAPMHLQLR